jgi:hypothetical protein
LSGAARRRKKDAREAAENGTSGGKLDRATQDVAIEQQLATKAAGGDVMAARTLLDWRTRAGASAVQGDAWLDLLTPTERDLVSTLIDRAERRSRGEELADLVIVGATPAGDEPLLDSVPRESGMSVLRARRRVRAPVR